ncbi:unnamed protein product, partial [Rotaria sp. Silwood1]
MPTVFRVISLQQIGERLWQ